MKLTESTILFFKRVAAPYRLREKGATGIPGKMVLLLVAAGIMAGCSTRHRAPVFERGEPSAKREVPAPPVAAPEPRAPVHVVQQGETLYSIAFNYGIDYHELAALNGIQDPSVISVGQELRLAPPGGVIPGTGEMAGQTGTEVAAVRPVPPVESRPLPFPARPQVVTEVKEQPLQMKLAYSEAALAQIKARVSSAPAVAEPVTGVEDQAEARPASKPVSTARSDSSGMGWIMPTEGKVIAGFSEADNRKGIDIAGKLGQPVVASASGKVVYSGNDLRGYGKMGIIKHDNDFISAYAHNDQLLVKLGQTVARGQKIALMGDSDADQVKLHFEVRYHGKPVDPAKYLPPDQF